MSRAPVPSGIWPSGIWPSGVWIVQPPGYPHSRALDDVALALTGGFRELGAEVAATRDFRAAGARPLVLGANLFRAEAEVPLPPDSILFNLEQISPGSPWLTATYLRLLRSYRVWDYSETNIAQLRRLGVRDVRHCGIGYADALTRIPEVEEDIDVLFYGSMNERRHLVCSELRSHGVEPTVVFGVYGDERDALIARARIILNLHFYPAKVFEIVRVSYLLANRRFVISERSPEDEIVRSLSGGLVFCDYDRVAAECVHYLKRKSLRQEIAKKGFFKFRRQRQSDFIRRALGLQG